MLTIITGGSNGIGLATCQEIIKKDANNYCAIVDLVEPNYNLFKENNLNQIKYFPNDVSDHKSVIKCAREIYNWKGNINTLVTCAGINIIHNSLEYKISDWNRIISVNLNGTFNWCQIASRYIKNNTNGGSIVTIGSIASKFGFVGRSAYTASKLGVEGLVKVLSNEFARFNIRVNCVSPGFTDTNLLREKLDEGVINLNDLVKQNSIKRIASTDEIANVIFFLLSDLSSYVTGQNIFVDGGFINNKMD